MIRINLACQTIDQGKATRVDGIKRGLLDSLNFRLFLGAVLAFILLMILGSDEAFAQVSPNEEHACTSIEQEKLRRAEKESVRLISQWQNELNENKDKNRKNGSENSFFDEGTIESTDEDDAVSVLECAKGKLQSGMSYSCHYRNVPWTAWTFPIFGKEIKLKYGVFDYYEKDIISILIHEVSHKCGTNDADYFNRRENHPRNAGTRWPHIADTYAYWARFGFCNPNIDCGRN